MMAITAAAFLSGLARPGVHHDRKWSPARTTCRHRRAQRRIVSRAKFEEFSVGSAVAEEGVVARIEKLVRQAVDRPVDVDPLGKLQNRYIAVRHGQSEANLDGIISSDVKFGTTAHGLTGQGRRQSRIAATSLVETIGRDNLDRVVIYSSPYKRALETANEAAAAVCNLIKFENEVADLEEFECPPVLTEPLLRERWFGELDGKIITSYNQVWPVDMKDATHNLFGCESVTEVCVRVRSMFLAMEKQHSDRIILLFGHADVLQILQMYCARADPRLFSQYRFRNGEVRELIQDPHSLPSPVPLTYQ
eukprot:Plantae.Rhodophyta-Purpureofilum_apyrenoidigerum.ctg25802.p1 GENE.Plantae.Rhodophyta-Purpureofilum_apyrenoidigerum.ctg25802~~Plantae.Rhodophyta-Purpureofilum_apyrenoidigerum.ctg25802.p1  ORF type:complete len:306 (+),score=46.56 Plantae.Rhodophyta-Purpureofilum_apyrenoidigerum.ctg25802:251-1168(+)